MVRLEELLVHVLGYITWTPVVLTRVYMFQREEHKVPVATLFSKAERKDLETVPEGFVVVRRMTYGEKMQRLESTGKMRILSNKVDKDAVGEINMMKAEVQRWEFAHLIMEHNLEHQMHTGGPECYEGTCQCPVRKLNFKDPNDVDLLSGRVGEEIANFMDKLNNFEEDEDIKNSSSGSKPESSSTDL